MNRLINSKQILNGGNVLDRIKGWFKMVKNGKQCEERCLVGQNARSIGETYLDSDITLGRRICSVKMGEKCKEMMDM